MTPRIPGYHFQPPSQLPLVPPYVTRLYEPLIIPVHIPEYPYSPEKLSGYAAAWEPKPVHPEYPYLPYFTGNK